MQCCGQLHSQVKQYSNIEKELLDRLHGPEKLHCYYFISEVSMITDHKQLVAVFKKDVASLSHSLQRIELQIHQYSTPILNKPGPQEFIMLYNAILM